MRTFAPIVAGISKMHYRTFVTYNVIGAALWAGGVTMAGYLLGSTIPSIDRYLLPIIAVIVAISLIPVAIEARRNRAKRAAAATEVTADPSAADPSAPEPDEPASERLPS